MSNIKRIIIAVVAVLAVAAGAVAYSLLVANKTSAPEAAHHDHNDGTHSHEGARATEDKDVAATITYDGSAFTLSRSEVSAGSNVKITNDSSRALDFGSDPHPTHTDNPELNAGDIPPHESKTITLEAKGEWGFHNHYNPSQRGSITVK